MKRSTFHEPTPTILGEDHMNRWKPVPFRKILRDILWPKRVKPQSGGTQK